MATAAGLIASGACPEARQITGTNTEQRRKAIARIWRDEAKSASAPLVAAEPAWTLTLPMTPSAAGAMDDRRIYVPLHQELLVALDRETGLIEWTHAIDTTLPPIVGDETVFVLSGTAIHALDAADGSERWNVPFNSRVTAPPVWDSGWLIVVAEPGEVIAFRASNGDLVWRRKVGATSSHRAIPGGDNALYVSLVDGRLVALALTTGDLLWEQKLTGAISEPAVAKDRVFVGSTNNFFYAFDDDSGTLEWKWRNGGDVIGADADGDVVYLASLDNIIRAVNRGNGNQRWKKPTGTRPVFPPRAFLGIVVLPGLTPAVTVFVGETGAVLGTQAAGGNLIGPPLMDRRLKPFHVAFVTVTREGVVEAFRPAAMMFRETALAPMPTLPGRALIRERLELTDE